MKWIVENLTREPSYLELVEAIKKSDGVVQEITKDFYKKDIAHYNNEKVLFCGSIEMNKLIGDQLRAQGCWPVTYSNFNNYLCTKFYPHFSKYLFNDNYVIVPLSEIFRRKYFFYGLFGREGLIFIRPDSGDKPFKAGLFDIQDFDREYEILSDFKNDLVIISSPKNIRGEWRFLVTNKKQIIAVSSYRFQNLLTRIPSAPKEAIQTCEEILNIGYYPDDIFCIDIAQDNDGNCWLMELTSFSSAGLYAMNKSKVVEQVTQYIN